MDNIDVSKCRYNQDIFNGEGERINMCTLHSCCCDSIDSSYCYYKSLQLANKTIESQKDLINSGAKTQVKLIVRNYKLNQCLDKIEHILEINKRELDECLFNNINGEILQKIKEVKEGN